MKWCCFVKKDKNGKIIIGVAQNDYVKKYDYIASFANKSEAEKEAAKISKLPRKEKLRLVDKSKEPLQKKLFAVVNEGFVCGNCGKNILPTTCGSPRNHCPFCLYSKHVDINVGDRSNSCKGLMKPIGIIKDSKKGYIIVSQCLICGHIAKSKAILQKDVQADEFDLILELSKRPIILD